MFGLITAMSNSVHIKNIQNGQYLMTNTPNLKTYGFSKESEFIGLTFNEINDFMRSYWGKGFADKIFSLEEKVRSSGITNGIKNLVFRDKNNFIRCQDLYKTPIFCKNASKVSMILTMTVEHTDKMCLIDLYGKYKSIYESKRKALRYFMQYLKVDRFLYEPLTEKELLCLLYAIQNQYYKNIAGSLDIGARTVATHMASITNKLKNSSIRDVISFLRSSR
jgi:DNA-binding CsgD family transcriptional regulator